MAEGRPIKAIAVARHTTAEALGDDVEKLVLKLAQAASSGGSRSLRRLRMLHQATVDSEEQGRTFSRLLPGGVAAGRWAWSLLAHGLGIPPEPVIPVLAVVAAVSAVVGVANLAAALPAHRAGPVRPATALRAE